MLSWLATAKSSSRSNPKSVPVNVRTPPTKLSFSTQQVRDQPWNWPKRTHTPGNTVWRSKDDAIFNKRRFEADVDEIVNGFSTETRQDKLSALVLLQNCDVDEVKGKFSYADKQKATSFAKNVREAGFSWNEALTELQKAFGLRNIIWVSLKITTLRNWVTDKVDMKAKIKSRAGRPTAGGREFDMAVYNEAILRMDNNGDVVVGSEELLRADKVLLRRPFCST